MVNKRYVATVLVRRESGFKKKKNGYQIVHSNCRANEEKKIPQNTPLGLFIVTKETPTWRLMEVKQSVTWSALNWLFLLWVWTRGCDSHLEKWQVFGSVSRNHLQQVSLFLPLTIKILRAGRIISGRCNNQEGFGGPSRPRCSPGSLFHVHVGGSAGWGTGGCFWFLHLCYLVLHLSVLFRHNLVWILERCFCLWCNLSYFKRSFHWESSMSSHFFSLHSVHRIWEISWNNYLPHA